MRRDGRFWESYDGRSPLYRAEAADYLRRLLAAVPVDSSARVLDFGCGLGFVARGLSPRVRELCLWDASPHMRALAAANTAACANARMLAAPPEKTCAAGPFDLVLLNSVLQYVDEEGAREMLAGLRRSVSSNGVLVVSDVLTPEARFGRELAQLFRFGLQQRLLPALLRESARIGGEYVAALWQSPLQSRTIEGLRRLAEAASLSTELLPTNLTFRTERIAVVLRPLRPRSGPDDRGATGEAD